MIANSKIDFNLYCALQLAFAKQFSQIIIFAGDSQLIIKTCPVAKM